MKKYRFFFFGFFFLVLFGFSSCNMEGDCTMVCECNFGGYSSTSRIELGGGYTKDECKDEAYVDDVAGCDCTGDWSRSRD